MTRRWILGASARVAASNRRSLLRAVGAGAAAVGAAGCSRRVVPASRAPWLGRQHQEHHDWLDPPADRPLAGFGAPDNWVISKIKQTTPYKNRFKIGSKTYTVTIKSYDSQSSSTRAGDLARTAILNDTAWICCWPRPRRRPSTRSPARPNRSARR